MGKYINPGNEVFKEALRTDYIDKTALIEKINQSINSTEKLICISRPRRFGKSYAAKMFCAYYDHTCDSHGLFDDLMISQIKGYEEHINRYHVIFIDITNFISIIKRKKGDYSVIPEMIARALREDLLCEYPDLSIYS